MSIARKALGLFMGLFLFTGTAPVHAGFTYFSDRGAFDAANPGTVLEDFEDATSNTVVSGPQDQFSDNAAFQPGDIIPNLRITAVGTFPDEFFVNINSYGPTTVMTTNYGDDFARLDFYEAPITAFGVDLSSFGSSGDYTIRIYGTSGLFDTQVVSPSAFFGFTSTEGVTRVELQAPLYETFDNIAIGGQAVPEPSSVVMLGLGGLGMLGYARARRTRKA